MAKNKVAKRYYFVSMQFLEKRKKKENELRVFGFSPGCHFDATAIGFLLVCLLAFLFY